MIYWNLLNITLPYCCAPLHILDTPFCKLQRRFRAYKRHLSKETRRSVHISLSASSCCYEQSVRRLQEYTKCHWNAGFYTTKLTENIITKPFDHAHRKLSRQRRSSIFVVTCSRVSTNKILGFSEGIAANLEQRILKVTRSTLLNKEYQNSEIYVYKQYIYINMYILYIYINKYMFNEF